ncbi:MAG: hypothetical protein PF590_09495 [Candidatus Delongbacteria bacterium]|nr:hypothetical protein [Candidatus Delongbacteria bacterium]
MTDIQKCVENIQACLMVSTQHRQKNELLPSNTLLPRARWEAVS